MTISIHSLTRRLAFLVGAVALVAAMGGSWSTRTASAAPQAAPRAVTHPAQTTAALDDDGPGTHPPALYATGLFTTSGGVTARNIARFDGTQWSALGPGFGPGSNGYLGITTLFFLDDDGPGPRPTFLYAGGYFSSAGDGFMMRPIAFTICAQRSCSRSSWALPVAVSW